MKLQSLSFPIKKAFIVETSIKKILLIIFKYHKNNKKILFVGMSNINFKNKSNHLFLPSYCWVSGLLSNKATAFKYLKTRLRLLDTNNLKTYYSLKTKPDLVVLLTSDHKTIIMKEAMNLKVPVLTLATKTNDVLRPLIGSILELN